MSYYYYYYYLFIYLFIFILLATRDYQGAFNNIRDLFNSVTVTKEQLIIITDDSAYDFDGATFNNVAAPVFFTAIYFNQSKYDILYPVLNSTYHFIKCYGTIMLYSWKY